MEKTLRALERRFGHLAIPNIGLFVVIPKILFFLVWFGRGQPGSLYAESALIPRLVLESGEWMRIFTFVCVPPVQSLFFFIFYAYLTWLFCAGLERQWGAFRLNVYLLITWLATVCSAFFSQLVIPGDDVVIVSSVVPEETILFAFAILYPNFVLNLFFILPVKVKYLAIFGWFGLGFQIWGTNDWPTRVVLLCVVLNYFLFFGPHHIRFVRDRAGARRRRKKWQDAMDQR